MRMLSALSLRGRFLLVVLLGAVVPLSLVGVWLASAVRRSGEELVRGRLDESLAELVNGIGTRWTVQRSALLDLGSARAIQLALRAGLRLDEVSDTGARGELERLWWEAAPIVTAATIRDSDRRLVADLPADLQLGVPESRRGPGVLLHRMDIYAPTSVERLGEIELAIRVTSLLPSAAVGLGVGGGLVALRDARTGDAILPLAADPDLFTRERFTWRGDDWLVAERRLGEPPLHVALAFPIGPVTQSFGQAARRGTVALALVTLAALVLVTLFVRQLTGSLEHLSKSAAEVSRGRLSLRAVETGPPEVRETARAFNSMTESLSRTLQRLSQQEAVAAVGEFAASLAHEVRNPLSSIRVDLQRSRRKLDKDSDEAVKLVDRALVEIDRLNESVSNFLRIARSGRVSRAITDLRLPLDAAVRAATGRFEERRAALEYVPSDEPLWVAADPSAVEQLVLNLLLNAADVLDAGERAVLAVDRREGNVAVSVRDQGPGIPAEDLHRVFEPFFTTKQDGTGLGLSVARRIALAHGSDLEVESVGGRGTTFRFVLPLDVGPSATAHSVSAG